MPEEVCIVLPNQLFQDHPGIRKGRTIILIEEELFFRQYRFHKKKLVLHRASMKYYQALLQEKGFEVIYIESGSAQASISACIAHLANEGSTSLHMADPVDDWIRRRVKKSAKSSQLAVHFYPTPQFLDGLEESDAFFDAKGKYFQADFYTWQRKRKGILVDEKGKPFGGKWSFDAENRKKLPKGARLPRPNIPSDNSFVKEARQYVDLHFNDHYGETSGLFGKEDGFYPVTHAEAEQWLDDFLAHRFDAFGDYEDAMAPGEDLIFHSCLTPMLNTGLLTPQYVLHKVLDTAASREIPLNSLEGFIRQVIGWREFIRVVYEREGRRQRTTNYWGFERKIQASFWTATTGIAPIDLTIEKTLRSGYSHHIERLMILANFMLLCEFRPDEVYRWFMEMYIDAYDWVMVPNVYGMTQFADGGLMVTKPYISGSNYLMKMGNWPKGEWQEIWDGLFWRFMDKQRTFFSQNPRLGMLVGTLDKMEKAKKDRLFSKAEAFLKKLDEG